MPNITLSIDSSLLETARAFADRRGMSFNSLVRELLSKTVGQSSDSWVKGFFEAADRAKGNSKGRTWTRAELYDV